MGQSVKSCGGEAISAVSQMPVSGRYPDAATLSYAEAYEGPLDLHMAAIGRVGGFKLVLGFPAEPVAGIGVQEFGDIELWMLRGLEHETSVVQENV